MSAPTPQQAWQALPPVAKTYLSAITIITILATINIIHPYTLLWNFELLVKKFQLWRLLTPFLYFGEISFGWLMSMMFIWQYCSKLEKLWFVGVHGTADFVFMLLFGGFILLATNAVLPNFYIYGPSMLMMLVHIAARKDPFSPVNFWGFSFLAWHFPFLLMFLHMLMGGGMSSAVRDLIGILTGHLYFFLTDIYPKVRGVVLLETPTVVVTLVERHIPNAINAIMRGFGGRVVTIDSANQSSQPQWRRSQGYRLDS